MNINELTIGEAKELVSIFGASQIVNKDTKQSTLCDSYVGKYVIVRTRNEGINFGKVSKADETGIILEEARRIWYHKPADKSMAWYEGVAVSGPSDDTKMSVAVPSKAIIEEYSITECTEKATKMLLEHKNHGQN